MAPFLSTESLMFLSDLFLPFMTTSLWPLSGLKVELVAMMASTSCLKASSTFRFSFALVRTAEWNPFFLANELKYSCEIVLSFSIDYPQNSRGRICWLLGRRGLTPFWGLLKRSPPSAFSTGLRCLVSRAWWCHWRPGLPLPLFRRVWRCLRACPDLRCPTSSTSV